MVPYDVRKNYDRDRTLDGASGPFPDVHSGGAVALPLCHCGQIPKLHMLYAKGPLELNELSSRRDEQVTSVAASGSGYAGHVAEAVPDKSP